MTPSPSPIPQPHDAKTRDGLYWPGGWSRRRPARTMREIAEEAAATVPVRLADLRKPFGPLSVSRARHDAMAAMHDEGFSHNQIVRFFRLKNHTTSIYACRAVADRRALAQRGAA